MICRFASDVFSEKEKTPMQLFIDSGYLQICDEITKKDIIEELVNHPHIVDSWLSFTEAKRWSPAWGIRRVDDQYEVFYVSNDGEHEVIRLESRIEACALMIQKEMEALANTKRVKE